MNGLLSDRPSPSALRLAVGGYVLLFAQTFLLLLLEQPLTGDLRKMAWLVTFVSGAALVGALCGLPRGDDFRGRHDR